jgi:type II secretory pathway component PulC
VIRITLKLFLLFILVYVGVHLWYARLEKRLMAESSPTPQSVVATSSSRQESAEKPGQSVHQEDDFQVIVARNIFEAVPEQAAKPEEEPVQEKKEPEQTTLKLVLQGTVSGSERDARAIIVDEKEKKQDLYQVGDAVQGAIITAIERGRVILELNGRKQFLLITDREGGGSAGGTAGFVPEPSAVGARRSRASFSRTGDRMPPAVVPHRRISFRQEKSARPPESEEPEQPITEEDLQGEEPLEGPDLKAGDLIQ